MKKFISVLLVLAISISVSGCGTSSVTSDKIPDSPSTSSAAPKRAILGEITSKFSSEEEVSTSSEALSGSSESEAVSSVPEEASRTGNSSAPSTADESSSSEPAEISPKDWVAGNVPSLTEASSSEPEVTSSVSEPESIPAAPQPESKPAAQPKKSSGVGRGNADNFNTYDNPEQQQTEDAWVLNLNSKKIHYPHCSEVKKIAPKNYSTSNLPESELLNQGYTTCGRCH